ncbi:MAG: sulfite exporter TauE/SafE family protein, partial [Burkholderiales bacterium]
MKIRTPGALSKEHEQLGIPPAEASASGETAHPVLNVAAWFTLAVLAALTVYLASRLNAQVVVETLGGAPFWSAVAVGFFAQAVDGALGMAYGVTATTFLLGAGASPAAASASVHIAEIFTTGFSGVSHLKYGNVNKQLFLRLLVPGMVGAVLGTIVITQIDGKILKPYVTAYLLLMGLYILSKAFRRFRARAGEPGHVGKL